MPVITLDEIQKRRPGDGTGINTRQQDGGSVVGLDAVGAGRLAELLCVLVKESSGRRTAWAGQHGILGGFAGRLDELRVFETVGAGEQAGETSLTQLLQQQRTLGVVRREDDRIRRLALDLSYRGREILVTLLHRNSAGGVGYRAEGIGDRLGLADAGVGAVIDDADLLHAEFVLEVIGQRWALHGVTGQATEEGLPPLLRQHGVGRRRGDGNQTGLIEHRTGRLGLTGPGGADQPNNGRVVDDLRRDRCRLLRITLSVKGFQLYLASRVGGVVLIDRELSTVPDISAEWGIGSGQWAGHGDLHGRAVGFTVPGRADRGRSRRQRDLGAVLVDRHLRDDLEIGLGRTVIRLGLGAPGNAQHRQCRNGESGSGFLHLNTHVCFTYQFVISFRNLSG